MILKYGLSVKDFQNFALMKMFKQEKGGDFNDQLDDAVLTECEWSVVHMRDGSHLDWSDQSLIAHMCAYDSKNISISFRRIKPDSKLSFDDLKSYALKLLSDRRLQHVDTFQSNDAVECAACGLFYMFVGSVPRKETLDLLATWLKLYIKTLSLGVRLSPFSPISFWSQFKFSSHSRYFLRSERRKLPNPLSVDRDIEQTDPGWKLLSQSYEHTSDMCDYEPTARCHDRKFEERRVHNG